MITPFFVENHGGFNLDAVCYWKGNYTPETGNTINIWLIGNETSKPNCWLTGGQVAEFKAIIRAIAQMQSDERGKNAATGGTQE